MVKAGEHGGLLAEILDRLAGFLEASARLRKKVKSAMTYPVIVICIAFAITTFLHRQSRADLRRNLQGFRRETARPDAIPDRRQRFHARRMVFPYPRIRRRLFSAFGTFCARPAASSLSDRWKLKLPVFGPLMHKICMSRFSRTFAQLIRSGVPILEVLDIVGGSSGNHVVEQSIKGVSEDVEKGDNLSVALVEETDFPADDAAHGRGRRSDRQDRHHAGKNGRLLGRRNRSHARRADLADRAAADRVSRRDRRWHRDRDVPADLQAERSSFAEQKLVEAARRRGRGRSQDRPSFLFASNHVLLFLSRAFRARARRTVPAKLDGLKPSSFQGGEREFWLQETIGLTSY